ncbi:hypothetical protein ACFQUU_04325 [Herbaspirillum sp. GCM10030257]|uniref:hypothetical protein n=1 Tax=Herbaspirillum sp. GCM10030257 TaxID=3273393 RepID=UPI00360C6DCB
MTPVFSWKRLGKLFDPQLLHPHPWMMEFAQCPTPLLLDEHTVRVFFATRPQRDSKGLYVSRPGYVDLSRYNLQDIKAVSPQPLLELGQTGAFDEFGIMPSSVVRDGNDLYMYYTGWTRMESVPYTTAIGVAVSHDHGKTFSRIAPGPVLGLSLDEPYMVNSPIVKIINDCWHMWYVSGKRWIETEAGPEIVFQHAHATSSDGLHWKQRRTSIVPALSDDECQDLLCPIQIDGQWHAFFAYRNATGFRTRHERAYRLAYARSDDLQNWTRYEIPSLLERSDEGWDSQMICSTQFLEMDGRRWLFYCGNEFGRAGFGAAELLVTPTTAAA